MNGENQTNEERAKGNSRGTRGLVAVEPALHGLRCDVYVDVVQAEGDAFDAQTFGTPFPDLAGDGSVSFAVEEVEDTRRGHSDIMIVLRVQVKCSEKPESGSCI